ncbi:alpha/beta hydrolase [Sorangium sp. So ce429]
MLVDVTFTLPRSGLTVRGRRSTAGEGTPCLCLHGWLDNCASFEALSQHLPGLDLLAIDLPGHGLSEPVPSGVHDELGYAALVVELAHALGFHRYNLVGHSLGGAVASLVAGVHPEKVARLVLLDAIGPVPAAAEETRASVARHLRSLLEGPREIVYSSRQQAVKARVQLADLLWDTAERLVERDLREVPGGYTWRSDWRLKLPAVRTLGEEQILAFLRAIAAPTLLIMAERTALKEPFYPRRIESVRDIRVQTLAGGHHLHMENAEQVAEAISAFLLS